MAGPPTAIWRWTFACPRRWAAQAAGRTRSSCSRSGTRPASTVSLNRFVAALINFRPGRGEIFASGHGHWVRVNVRGDTWTDVTEGSSGAQWERLRCDWSELNVVRLTTIDSNIWRPESGWVLRLT